MKQMLVALTMFLTSASAWAASGLNVVIALPDHPRVAIFQRQQADYVAIPVTISSDQRDPIQRLAEMRATKRLIQKKAEGNPDIIVEAGQVTLSDKLTSKPSTRTDSSNQTFTALLHLLVPLKGKGRDVFICAAMVRRFLGEIPVPGKASIRTGEMRLAVENPEQYRPALLQMISDAIAKTEDALKSKGASEVSGLVGPVLARQADDENVELFIDFQLQIETK